MKNMIVPIAALVGLVAASPTARAYTEITVNTTETLTSGGASSPLTETWSRQDDADVEVTALADPASVFYNPEVATNAFCGGTALTRASDGLDVDLALDDSGSSLLTWSRRVLQGETRSGLTVASSGREEGLWFKTFVATNCVTACDSYSSGGSTSTLSSRRIIAYEITVRKSSGLPEDPLGARVSPDLPFVDESVALDGTVRHTFNGAVYEGTKYGGLLCGLAQITTAKGTRRGVRVSGYVLMGDGKKHALKAAYAQPSNGVIRASFAVAKLGTLALTLSGSGFEGQVGDACWLRSSELPDGSGVVHGTLRKSYFDATTGKLKTKSVSVDTAVDARLGVASGTVAPKGESSRKLRAYLGEEAEN